MKKGNFTSLVLLSGALAFPAFAEKVKFEQLPPDLQEKIRAQVGSAPIEDIDRETKNGKTTYEIAYKKDGQHTETRIEHNDSSTSTATASTALDSRKMRYEELPEVVKRAADARLKGAEVNDVDRQVKNGRTTYEIGYKQNNGPQQELILADDGRILRSRSSAVAGSSTAPNQPNRNYRGMTAGTANSSAASTRVMEYTDLPSNVRRVADSKLRDGDVSKVERRLQNGQISYEIGFAKENGQYQQLVIAEDGRVLRDQTGAKPATGAPSSVESGANASSSSQTYSSVTAPVQLDNSVEISRNQLPVSVARSVRGYTATPNIKEIHRGEWQGKTVYQVSYPDRDNRYVQLQLDENGQVIYDPLRAPGTPTQNLFNNLGRALFDNK